MQLTLQTDYALRLLMYVGAAGSEPVPVARIAHAYGISSHHLSKVAQRMAALGYVELVRGRSGGVVLSRPPASVDLGDLVDRLEDTAVVECLDPRHDRCRLSSVCRLKGALDGARQAFLASLRGTSLADLLDPPAYAKLLSIGPARPPAPARA
jgi:Rrf2 family nitric oxide-sensitive transcriptional repressor